MGWMIWGLNPGSGNRFFLSPKWPEWLWNSPNFLINFTAIFLSKHFFPFENIAVDINVGNFKDIAW
jgi:hypothetical protein